MKLKIYGDLSYFWQWDLNRKLVVEDDGVCSQVHFCNGSGGSLISAVRDEDGIRVAKVPDVLLQKAAPITAYLYTQAEDGTRTRKAFRFTVIARSKPEDYVCTTVEEKLENLEARVDQIEDSGISDEKIEEVVTGYLEKNPVEVKGVVKTVNGKAPDENGNVEVDIPEGGNASQADWVATKEETGDNTVYIPEQKASGLWNNLQASLKVGSVYDVTINGEVYVCTAVEDDGVLILGNNPSLTLNDYPFCVTWAGAGATSGMFFKNSNVISSPVTLKVTGHYEVVYNQLPEEYLPDCVVKSVNGKRPYANGNVEIPTGTVTEEQIASAVEDYMAEHPGGSGLNSTAKNLLITILRNGIYSNDQSANITALANALDASGGSTGGDTGGDTGGGGEEPEIITYTVTNNLTEATNSNVATTAERNTAYTATLTPSNGYRLNEVTVTMGGANITDTVYADGAISIPAVTGNVVITVVAVVDDNVTGYVNLFDKNTMVRTGGFIAQGGYLYSNEQSSYAVVPVEAGKQYALQGGWSAFSTTQFGALAFGSDDNWGSSGIEYYIKPVSGLNSLSCLDSTDKATDAFTASKDTSGKGMTFTVPAGCAHIAFSIYIKNTNSNCDPGTVMLEVGDTCHDYVPYAG